MAQIDRSFVGEGIIYGRIYQSAEALTDLGNCDTFNLSFATERKTLPNYRGGGGNRNVRERVTDVTATVGMFDIVASNLARVTKAVIAEVAAGAVTAEALGCKGEQGELIPFKHLPDLRQPVTLVTAADVALQPGTDYLLTAHGVIVTPGSLIDDTGIKASYTRLQSSAVQMLAGSQFELELFIAGLNDAKSGEPFALRVHRAKFGLAKEIPMFGTEFMRLEAPVELLASDLVQSGGISKFCQMDLVTGG